MTLACALRSLPMCNSQRHLTIASETERLHCASTRNCCTPGRWFFMCNSMSQYRRNIGKKCSVPKCERPAKLKLLCLAHYQRVYKTGQVRPDEPITKSHSGSRNSNWRGGQVIEPSGRVLVYMPNHPNAKWCGTHVYRYRLVMEKHLGRYLTQDDIVHHRNGIVNDDRIENLVLTTRSKHAKAHNINGKFSHNSKEIE